MIALRLKQIAEHYQISLRQFDLAVGKSAGYLSKQLSVNQVNVGSDVISSVVENYPEINIDWLLTGKGQMLKEDQEIESENLGVDINKVIDSRIDKRIEDRVEPQLTDLADRTSTIEAMHEITRLLGELSNDEGEGVSEKNLKMVLDSQRQIIKTISRLEIYYSSLIRDLKLTPPK